MQLVPRLARGRGQVHMQLRSYLSEPHCEAEPCQSPYQLVQWRRPVEPCQSPDQPVQWRRPTVNCKMICIYPLSFNTPPLRVSEEASKSWRSVGIDLWGKSWTPFSLDEVETLHVSLQCASVNNFREYICNIVSAKNFHKGEGFGADLVLHP